MRKILLQIIDFINSLTNLSIKIMIIF